MYRISYSKGRTRKSVKRTNKKQATSYRDFLKKRTTAKNIRITKE